MIFVYVIYSVLNGKRYVGITADLNARLNAHAKRNTKGGQQLGNFTLIHEETFPSYGEARVREKFLKSGQGRKWLDQKFGVALSHQTVIDRNPS